ncbi:amino acid ABC transporter substrate-binding protein, PAAT family [Rhizobium tibeticum]|uniref:Amino acid ABC transporter substrate-binding protein, PAAT family n=1 Tax=Rhizobium tibeticum TaxID=501024 RepID=A0A1H8QZY7_9HYPH|nr:transporter substrate-binding domain-containing protein [Rhizobium tibeticum]SEI06063.1 Glutamine-binding periplasmic protein precursor [Rhizobium tibeticum]SEO59203.1 amino acid ABC transporter substrate-binding protein, PAAT family [Rhizobium tibeticum]
MMAVSLAVFDASSGRNWLPGVIRYVGRALIGLAALGAAAVGESSVYGQMPQQTNRDDFPQRELVIGTKEAPPFAMKDADGNWSGISIELWREVAQKLGLQFRLSEEPDVQKLIEATTRGDYDVSVAAITITAERERSVDFSQPFYDTGLGIAVSVNSVSVWREIIRTKISAGFLQAAGALIGISLLVGALVWLFERRHNDDFGGPVGRGLGASIWWSAEAMTQASTGHRGPITIAGRALAIIWMVVSIITIAVFTASVTSALTTRQMRGLVNGVEDLPNVRVGTLANSATIGFLDGERIKHSTFAQVGDGLKALDAGSIDAFVYDKPLLAWTVEQHFSSIVQVLDIDFEPQSYGLAMPLGRPYRKAIDVAVLEAIHDQRWRRTLFQYLGEKR